MADLVPAQIAANLPGPGGPALTRLRELAAQPAARKMLPWFGGMAALGLAALTWSIMSPAPQRVLYSSLGDGERAEVVAALDQARISYKIDNNSGALTVGEDDLYRARMMVASQGALAAPETGMSIIDSLPMGASRTLEGDRLRAAQERELQLTIMEIDGVEAVRVHLAQAERSVFVRNENPPTASVMLRLVRGKNLTDSQVTAIANLVAASVPGLGVQNVRIVDQHGNLLSDTSGTEADALELQARTEAKMRAQISQLLTPMLGAGNFSSEIQVELDMEEVTSARETYDRDGAVRAETTSETRGGGAAQARGVPGVLANMPPADPEAENRAPEGGDAAGAAGGETGETRASRSFELGREVAVSNSGPGALKRLSVAVALNADALEGATPQELEQIENLVSAAVGANPARGDTVAVMTRKFEPVEFTEAEFWETPWFATIVRNAAALLSVLLVLLLGVRPLLKMLRPARKEENEAESGEADGDEDEDSESDGSAAASASRVLAVINDGPDSAALTKQVELARRIAREQPDDALHALRRMLAEPPPAEDQVEPA